MITQTELYPPQPATVRANSTFLSYDSVNNRIAYASGKGIVIRSLDGKNGPVLFTKHTFTTTVAAFSPSGNYIASGDEAGHVKIWDSSVFGKDGFDQPPIKSEFQILSGPIRSIAWDADNSRVIAVGQGKDKFGHCFTWDTGNSIGEIQGHSETINAVDIKPQRPYRAATVGDDKAMVFFNGPPFKFDKSVRGHHTNSVRAVKFSPDGKWLVSVGSDRLVVVYDGKTGEYVNKIENAHKGGIFGVSWFPDSSAFVTSSADNSVKSWDAELLTEKHTYTVSESSVENQQVGVVVTQKYVASLSLNGNINLFDFAGSAPSKVLYGHQRSLTAVSFDKVLVTGGADGSLIRWEEEAQLFGSEKHANYVTSIVTSGSRTITAGWDDKLKVWDGKLEKTVDLAQQPKLVVCGEDIVVLFENRIDVYDSSVELKNTCELPFSASSIALCGSKFLVNNQTQNRVEELDAGLVPVRSYPVLRSTPSLIRVSPDGQYVAVAENTGKFTLYRTDDMSVVTTRWAFHSSKVVDAQWTPDSQYLVSGGLDSGIFVYSVARPSKVLKVQLAHQNGVTGLAWLSYDTKSGSFVSTGMDGAVKKWAVDFSAYQT